MRKTLNITVDICKGAHITTACSEVKELSELLKQDFTFDFNGVKITTENKSINEMVNSYLIKTK